MTNPTPTCIDLFCGCGGFTLGMQRAGFNVLAAIDFNGEMLPAELEPIGDVILINAGSKGHYGECKTI